jgi:FMN phosphatase YigB (HAD superfamily)
MNSKAILLDMDGVIFRNHSAHKQISLRCESFVKKITKVKNPIEINRYLYQTTGHTYLGLKKLGYNVTLEEFNKYVYSDLSILDSVNNNIALTNLKKRCMELQIPIYIFSNAPSIWCQTILHQMDCNIPILDFPYLKPTNQTYGYIQNQIPYKQLFFVDDSFINLLPVNENNRWIKFLFCPQKDTLANIHMISELDELIAFI